MLGIGNVFIADLISLTELHAAAELYGIVPGPIDHDLHLYQPLSSSSSSMANTNPIERAHKELYDAGTAIRRKVMVIFLYHPRNRR